MPKYDKEIRRLDMLKAVRIYAKEHMNWFASLSKASASTREVMASSARLL
ncbi:hypothetical protein CERSUDRAFT_101459 [Gelatoporia subvermispora B]|uniref:Uncharacterized protein n=1 Tax=Ceriporiopsis subvermispora (strain B) TaxID=914234 RepID=M2QED4_CERS8|nr:hypothetical protein CERSUDRAFT_101459 [Gelatoporia subvermispora B]